MDKGHGRRARLQFHHGAARILCLQHWEDLSAVGLVIACLPVGLRKLIPASASGRPQCKWKETVLGSVPLSHEQVCPVAAGSSVNAYNIDHWLPVAGRIIGTSDTSRQLRLPLVLLGPAVTHVMLREER